MFVLSPACRKHRKNILTDIQSDSTETTSSAVFRLNRAKKFSQRVQLRIRVHLKGDTNRLLISVTAVFAGRSKQLSFNTEDFPSNNYGADTASRQSGLASSFTGGCVGTCGSGPVDPPHPTVSGQLM